jgi:hypothetical protein
MVSPWSVGIVLGNSYLNVSRLQNSELRCSRNKGDQSQAYNTMRLPCLMDRVIAAAAYDRATGGTSGLTGLPTEIQLQSRAAPPRGYWATAPQTTCQRVTSKISHILFQQVQLQRSAHWIILQSTLITMQGFCAATKLRACKAGLLPTHILGNGPSDSVSKTHVQNFCHLSHPLQAGAVTTICALDHFAIDDDHHATVLRGQITDLHTCPTNAV